MSQLKFADPSDGEVAMQKAQAIYRNGQVEFDEPVNWPDGTKLDVCPSEPTAQLFAMSSQRHSSSMIAEQRTPETECWGIDDSQWPRTPDDIGKWLHWFDSREPVFAPDEQAAFDAELASSKQLQKSLTQSAWNRQEMRT